MARILDAFGKQKKYVGGYAQPQPQQPDPFSQISGMIGTPEDYLKSKAAQQAVQHGQTETALKELEMEIMKSEEARAKKDQEMEEKLNSLKLMRENLARSVKQYDFDRERTSRQDTAALLQQWAAGGFNQNDLQNMIAQGTAEGTPYNPGTFETLQGIRTNVLSNRGKEIGTRESTADAKKAEISAKIEGLRLKKQQMEFERDSLIDAAKKKSGFAAKKAKEASLKLDKSIKSLESEIEEIGKPAKVDIMKNLKTQDKALESYQNQAALISQENPELLRKLAEGYAREYGFEVADMYYEDGTYFPMLMKKVPGMSGKKGKKVSDALKKLEGRGFTLDALKTEGN